MLEFDNTFGTIDMHCDTDGCHTSDTFDGFDGHCDLQGAIKEAKLCGWVIKKEDGDWVHTCSMCAADRKENGK